MVKWKIRWNQLNQLSDEDSTKVNAVETGKINWKAIRVDYLYYLVS